MPEPLSAAEARRMFLRAQGLSGLSGEERKAGVPGVLRRLGAVQLDTISVLARSHELVAYARLGPVGRDAVEQAYWGRGLAFEYWAHAASIIPMEDWPLFEYRRRWCRNSKYWRNAKGKVFDEVRAALADGPKTAGELGGAKRGGEWWDWSDAKMAVETLLKRGEVVCVDRRRWQRVYDLAERAIPGELLGVEPDDETCVVSLLRQAARCLGVATREDLADYYRLALRTVDANVGEAGLVPVRVQGWDGQAWAWPAALDEQRASTRSSARHRTTLLSPFDSLVWDRARTERVFGLVHRLEAYTPKDKRVHGYFAMPVLAGGRIVGRVDPKREGKTLVAKRVTLQGPPTDQARAAVGDALREAAGWVGCHSVVVEESPVPIPV